MRFDERAKSQILSAPADALRLCDDRDYRAAAPTPDHFIPMLYFAGLAGARGDADVGLLVEGCAYGSISMTSYVLGSPCVPTALAEGSVPQPSVDVPADESNI